MGWWFLAAAIVFEVCGTTSLKLSDGLSRLAPSAAVVVFYVASFVCLSVALKRIDLSIAYAIWCAVGMAAIAVIGMVWFREPASGLKLASLVVVIAGLVGLNLASGR